MTTQPVIVLVGPTASGKTSVAIEVADRLGGEIVSADARQIYRFMDIGTAKPTAEEQARAVHHLIDVVEPDETFDAVDWAGSAAHAIEDIVGRGKRPIVAGGAGLYLEALFKGLSPIPDVPDDVRACVQVEAEEDLEACHRRLTQVDPAVAARCAPGDRQRITRALEVYEATGEALSEFQALPREPKTTRRSAWFGLDLPRVQLYARIDHRGGTMMEAGLLDEVRSLQERGYSSDLPALRTFGYRECFDMLEGLRSQDEALSAFCQATRRYAKRQLTWFRNRGGAIAWVHPDEAAERLIRV